MSKIQQVRQQNYNKPTNQLPHKFEKKVSFGSEAQKISTTNEESKGGVGSFVKTATNALGVLAWIGVVGYSIKKLKLLEPKSFEGIARTAGSLKKRAMSYAEQAGTKVNVDKVLSDADVSGAKKHLVKGLFKVGDMFQAAKLKTGDELFNNLTYAFGTLFVMPAVVLFSPFGKKESSKEDKMFAVLRQPLSVAATLGMQFTFDKLIGKFIPEAIKQNKLEDPSILDEEGKIVLNAENAPKIRYNADSAKDWFKRVAAEAGLTPEEIQEIFNNQSFEADEAATYRKKLQEILNRKYGEKGLSLSSLEDIEVHDIHGKKGSFTVFRDANSEIAKNIEKLLIEFKQLAKVLDAKKIKIQTPKTVVNVIAASAIGCTFLNVIYGKAMKAYKSGENNKLKENEQAKEVK